MLLNLKAIVVQYILQSIVENFKNKQLKLKAYKLRKLLIYPYFFKQLIKFFISIKNTKSMFNFIKLYVDFYNMYYSLKHIKKIKLNEKLFSKFLLLLFFDNYKFI
jgi:Ni/Fe-hydrogenase subunit HybB-like protein